MTIIYRYNLHIHFQVLCNPDLRLLLPPACPKTEYTSIAKLNKQFKKN